MGSRCRFLLSLFSVAAARPRLLAALLLGGLCLAPGREASAQNNSLFPKGAPNRNLPQATPLPRGALKPKTTDSPASAASTRRRPPPPPRPDTVALPYNLVWFDSQNRLASLFAGVSAKVVEKKNDGPNEIWTVNELIAPNLRTSFFTFQQGMLVGLEFDYGQDAWDTAKYNEVMGQFRRLLETKCEAPGELISRKTDQVPNSTVKETLTGYQWVRGDTVVQLFYYAAEDTTKALNFRSISVHYHYRDPFAPPGSEPSPAPGAQPSAPPSTGQTTTVTVTPSGPDDPRGGALPMPDNAPPTGSTPAPTAAPSPSPSASPAASPASSASPSPAASPAANAPTPTPAASPTTPDGTPPGPTPAASPAGDNGDAAAAMAPTPSPTPEASPTPTPSPTPSATPSPSPTPKKSSGRKKRG